ncbi:DUF5677 domain-containing protein [Sphingobacterium siyangense]|uniref:DUF5677 domain-containing protein n=1 Tax=Sphingobacterium siyangense TaxID=459529 RepID=UPI003DA3F70E
MTELERIRQIDNDVFQEFQNYFEKLPESNFIKLYPKTAYIISSLDTGANFIKCAIFDECEKDNYYAIKILYRSLIEHFFKFKIIMIQWGKSKSDSFAVKYLEYAEAREILDSLKAQVSEQQLFDPKFEIKDWNNFLINYPAFKNKTRKEVDIESQNYTFKNMIRSLNIELKSQQTPLFGKLINEYSLLSSFVHGGTRANKEMIIMNEEEERLAEYNRLCGLSLQQSASIKLFSLLMYSQSDPQFGEYYHKVNSLLCKLNHQ